MSVVQPERKNLIQKMIANPGMPIGAVGFIAIVWYGVKNYKKGGYANRTAYFGSLRVIAQGMVVGALGIGFLYDISKKYISPSSSEKK